MGNNGVEIGLAIGDAVAKGVSEWKQIQQDRQHRREFEGAMALASQRRGMIASAYTIQEEGMLQQAKALIQRSPNAQQVAKPTGGVLEDGTPETEQVIRTPEGDLSVEQLMQMQAKKQQADTQRELAEIDLVMETQARYPDNPYVKQWVASTYAGIQQKQNIRAKQLDAQRLQLDTANVENERQKFEQEIGLRKQQQDFERQKFEAAPGRAQEQTQFETDQRIRGDQARIAAEQAKELTVEGARQQNKPAPQPTEYQRKIAQMAPRAQEALNELNSLEQGGRYDRSTLGAGAESLLPNVLRSGKRQEYEQAQLQFVNSILRAESGATITESEIDKAKKQYFPQAGDSDQVVAQKRQARETAVDGLYQQAGLERPQGGGGQQGGWDAQGIRQAYKAGKLSKDQALSMLEKLHAQP